MKGLLIKDFCLMKGQKNFFFLIIAVTLGITVFGDDMTFALGFLTFVVSLFSLSTISYDEFDNGNAFLFTLPFTRTRYAVEKYVLALLLGGAGWILSTGTVILVNVYKDVLSISDITISAFMIIPAMLIIQAIMIPFHLKFGGEKGRLAIIGALGVVFALGAVIVKIADGMNVNLTTMLNGLTTINVTTMLVILFLIALLIWGISMMISISVMRKKEF